MISPFRLQALLIIVMCSFIISCGGGGSSNSESTNSGGVSGDSHVQATNVVSKNILSVGNPSCPNGGIDVNTGFDTNSNGVLDNSEIKNTQAVCNGIDGTNVTVAIEPSGSNCLAGGVSLRQATGNMTYICNGTNGTNGTNITMVAEPIGINCPSGGVRLNQSTGAVSYVCNGSSVTTVSEPAGTNCSSGGMRINQSTGSVSYVCNGSSVNAVVEPAGTKCPTGGVRLNQNTGSVTYVCNGVNGSNGTSITTNIEPAGVNCTAGGVRLTPSTGVVSYICNGINGTNGTGGTAPAEDSYISKTWNIGTTTSFTCSSTASYSNYKQQVSYFSLASKGIGSPYKTCIREYCSAPIKAGESYHNISSGSGDSTCPQYFQDQTTCAKDYTINSQGECVSTASACLAGQILTSRGCETPITACDQSTNTIIDNSCSSITFTDITGNICGKYTMPVKITSATHLVTCNTTFQERVIIPAGAKLLVDNNWSITAENKIYSQGTAANPVLIDISATNPARKWGAIVIGNSQDHNLDYDIVEGYKSGSQLVYTNIKNIPASTKSSSIFDTFIKSSQIDVTGIKIQASFVDSSALRQNPSFYETDIINSTATATPTSGYISFSNSDYSNTSSIAKHILWSTITSNSNFYSNGIGNIGAFFNTFNGGINCSYASSALDYPIDYIQGNVINGTISSTYCSNSTNTTDNSTSSGKVTAHIRNSDISAPVGSTQTVKALIFDKNGWIKNANIVWKMKYDVDGVYYDSGKTWTGYAPNINLDKKESYTLYIDTVNGSPASQLLGRHSIIISVY